MSDYTRTCNNEKCDALLKWNDDKKWFEDRFFPGKKHDHAKYKAVSDYNTESSNETNTSQTPNHETKQSYAAQESKAEGRECYTCKSAGFPGEIIFFNDSKKSKTGKVIPLDKPFPDEETGNWYTHEHKKEGDKPTVTNPVKESDDVPTVKGTDVNLLIQDLITSFDEATSWAKDIRPKLDTCVAYILDQSVKKANER